VVDKASVEHVCLPVSVVIRTEVWRWVGGREVERGLHLLTRNLAGF
jgi:hypothetical protein